MSALVTRERSLSSEDLVFLSFLAVFLPLMIVFAHNSGYGYDQLEYLVIARSLTEGIPFYTYAPSKSYGIYAFLALLMYLGAPLGHWSLSFVVAVLLCTITASTYLVVRRWRGSGQALTASVLVASAALFMEGNFLTTEAFVFLAGLAGYHLLLLQDRRRALSLTFLAGLIMALSTHFKVVGAFYGIGAAIFLLIRGLILAEAWSAVFIRLCAFSGGFAVAALAPLLYFAATGRFDDFWLWTVTYPLFNYPSNDTYLTKFVIKLLFFHIVIGTAAVLSLFPSVRKKVLTEPALLLSLLLGVFASVSLLKNQASHYYFAGAPFLLIFAVGVFSLFRHRFHPLPTTAFFATAALVVGLLAVSAILYRPSAFARFVTIRDFAEEDAIRAQIQNHLPPDKKLLVFDNSDTLWYWTTHRYPPPPFINNDEKTMWTFRNDPEKVLSALGDPQLYMVKFDPNAPTMVDSSRTWGKSSGDLRLWDRYHARLRHTFVSRSVGDPSWTIWVRKDTVMAR